MSRDLKFKSCGYTHSSVQKFCYEWTISNFSFCMDGNLENITSPVFSLEANEEEMQWCLRIHPNGIDEESKDYLSVYLWLLSCPESPVWATFQFWIVNAQGEKYQIIKVPNVLKFLPNQQWGHKKFILRDFLLFYRHWLLPEDQLTLCCKVCIVGPVFSRPGQNMTPAIRDPRQMLADDLGELWENPLFTDCTLLVAGQEFRDHKAILAAHSPVFRAMFEHEMLESLTNHIEIHDIHLQVFKEMMPFIYTGKAPHLHIHSMATGLLAVADMYDLQDLKVMCEDALCRNISVKNAVPTLILSDLHSADHLKTKAMDFIILHASEFSETMGWKSMVESYPHLVEEAFHSLSSIQCPFFVALT
ncbi:TD and POZ domain-containing protein 2-like [Rattus norvegicus]|uniref:TD and POZ domain-containing protein 2-like n=1 Tax=Rattus norvegicus TaxID=10116 RepID=UPI00001C7D96|nr:TD and POZ domain-containing protein 2-like [Rattus norvegicus]|eukprot:XP_002729143.1 PREDICTED: TD and POZ domain-containing protein 2-like isoform X1 [Rattus norvegicus]